MMNSLLKNLFLALFCFSFFDCLASSEDDLRSDNEIAPFIGLKTLTYTKKVKGPGSQIVNFDVPLVSVGGSSINRIEELKKCKYLRGDELSQDWEKFDQGNRTWLNQSRYLVFDTEVNRTTFEGEIIEICLLEFINGKATGLEFSTFIRPRSRIFSKYSQKIHGITYSKLLGMPFFNQIAEQLKTFIGDSVVIAHNASFDIRMLAQEYERLKTTNIVNFYYKCSYQMFRRDVWRDSNPTKIKTSPFKVKPVKYVSEKARKKRNAAKRDLEFKRKARTQKRKRERELEGTGIKSSKKQKITDKDPSTGGLAFFIESRELTTDNVPVILDIQTDLGGQHHNARFDTYVGAAKVIEFQQRELEKDIRSSQEGNDENDQNALNSSLSLQPSSSKDTSANPKRSPFTPLHLSGTR